jgi:hypothetical protein
MALYVQFGPPSLQSDLSNILARVIFRAGALPDDINFSRFERSSEVRFTKYFWYIFLFLIVFLPQVTRFVPSLRYIFDRPLEPKIPEPFYQFVFQITSNGTYRLSGSIHCPLCENLIQSQMIHNVGFWSKGIRKITNIFEAKFITKVDRYWSICQYERVP